MHQIRRVLDQILHLVVGRRCPGCGRPVVVPVCVACIDQIQQSPPVSHAAWRDDPVIGRLVRAAKRGEWRRGGRLLAVLVAFQRGHLIPECDVITWVPADRRRRASRGGHLPERFAKALGELLALPAIPLLEQPRSRRPQRGLGRAERAANVATAFRPRRRRVPALPEHTRVLVVDDVRTTGATLAAARVALAELSVDVATMAIVGVEEPRAHLRSVE